MHAPIVSLCRDFVGVLEALAGDRDGLRVLRCNIEAKHPSAWYSKDECQLSSSGRGASGMEARMLPDATASRRCDTSKEQRYRKLSLFGDWPCRLLMAP